MYMYPVHIHMYPKHTYSQQWAGALVAAVHLLNLGSGEWCAERAGAFTCAPSCIPRQVDIPSISGVTTWVFPHLPPGHTVRCYPPSCIPHQIDIPP